MPRYIDAEKLVQYVNDHSTHWLNEWDTLGVLAAIGKTPTADVQEVKHGRWMSAIFENKKISFEDEEKKFISDACVCSICGEYLTASDEYSCVGRYCPNCGAKMDEKETSDDVQMQ